MKAKDDKLKPALEKALADYAKRVGTGFEGALRDALTNLKHIADEYNVDIKERLAAALEVAKEEDEEKTKEFEVELYELHASKTLVHAKDKAEAILKAVQGEGDPMDDTCEYIEMADGYGMKANDPTLGLTKEEIDKLTKELGIKPGDSIPHLRQIDEVG
jgi:hypothetical protein